MRHLLIFTLYSFFIALLMGCIEPSMPFESLPPGKWRGVLTLSKDQTPTTAATKRSLLNVDNPTMKPIEAGQLPFTFEVAYDDKRQLSITFYNGDQKIVVPSTDITYGRDKATAKDTLVIKFPLYDTYLKAIYQERIMQGFWVVPAKDNYQIPFEATQGQDWRFTQLKQPTTVSLNGKWAATFNAGTPDEDRTVGEFVQTDNRLTGTFMTESGDYGYLEGTVQGERFYLSNFDGSHAFLFEGKALSADSIIGTFYSGTHHKATWSARRDANAALRDAHSLTTIKQPTFSLSLNDATGKLVTLDDAAYKGKIKFIQVMGTWCANCKDEAEFVAAYLKEKNDPRLTAIGLAFERTKDAAKGNAQLQTYKEKMNIPYTLLYAGYADKATAAQVLPQLEKVMAYPTMLIVDGQNKIRRVHTGFSGPATSEYATFKKEFDAFVTTLLAEMK